VRLAIEFDALDRKPRLAIGRPGLIQFLPRRKKVLVRHPRYGLRPAIGIEQDVRIGPDVLNPAFGSRLLCWMLGGRGRAFGFRGRLFRQELSGRGGNQDRKQQGRNHAGAALSRSREVSHRML